MLELNRRALDCVERMLALADACKISFNSLPGGVRLIDCGIDIPGGLHAGLWLARVCLADLGDVSLHPGELPGLACPFVQTTTDHPVAACLASQYAGWQLAEGRFFAMGSGPMRAAAGREDLFDTIGHRERPRSVVGVLETRKRPPVEIYQKIAEACQVSAEQVTLLVAPTASLAGGLQVVARSVETALHKLHELGFDTSRVISGQGWAPLPPVARDDLTAIGRTNDAILYGSSVILYVTGDDESIAELGPRVPSSASHDYGEPFLSIFRRYNQDFYAVDKMLFSPARIVFQNVSTGRAQAFGSLASNIVAHSFQS